MATPRFASDWIIPHVGDCSLNAFSPRQAEEAQVEVTCSPLCASTSTKQLSMKGPHQISPGISPSLAIQTCVTVVEHG